MGLLSTDPLDRLSWRGEIRQAMRAATKKTVDICGHWCHILHDNQKEPMMMMNWLSTAVHNLFIPAKKYSFWWFLVNILKAYVRYKQSHYPSKKKRHNSKAHVCYCATHSPWENQCCRQNEIKSQTTKYFGLEICYK